jgi:GT2 family glycosyltransferase
MDSSRRNIDNQPLISIVILNWNGHDDTIACLKSLAESSYDNFEVILVDNASVNNSVDLIKDWINKNHQAGIGKKFEIADSLIYTEPFYESINITIIENSENVGFAKANNIGIAQAIKHHADYVLLLNNDTVADRDSLQELIEFFTAHTEYSVATPQIRYFDKPEMIWNCGGKLTSLGSRKYFFDDRHFSELPETDYLKITFITGCALIAKTEVFKNFGPLTEDFFFGEEDYEFSIRMKKNKIKIACVLNSVIYHKVNSSISKASAITIGKIYIHYLNRFINLRNYMSPLKWQMWRHVYLIYIFVLLKFRHKIDFKVIQNFNKSLLEKSLTLKEVNKVTFEKYINCNFDTKNIYGSD